MARKLITLTCEICGKEFEAHAHRRVIHCRKCAEDLRRKGQGPVQTKRKAFARPPHNNLQAKEICWEHAENDLTYYLKRFKRFPVYDGVTPSDPHRITDEDRQLANKIAARMSGKTWAPLIGESIVQLGDWDLLNMSDLEWQSRKQVIHEVLSPLLRHPGIGIARLTKALHRKRPRLIPICDNVVQKVLAVYAGMEADGIIACMGRFRTIGRKYMPRLKELRELSKQLQAGMTELRILELLYWVQFGPFSPTSRES